MATWAVRSEMRVFAFVPEARDVSVPLSIIRPMENTELAWAAGFIDGEGYFGRANSKGGPNKRLVIVVAQVHRAPLDRLQALFGGKVYGPYPSRHVKGQPYHQWHLRGLAGVSGAFEAIRPYMCEPKRKQAEEALAGYAEWIRIKESRQPEPDCPRGHPFTDENTIVKGDGRRRCRACRDIYARANRDKHREYERRYEQSDRGKATRLKRKVAG